MNQDNFYVVLLSDRSMEFFSEDTATSFKTYLPNDIRLNGSWVVGLAEMQYPCSLSHIQNRDDAYVAFFKGDETAEEMHEARAYAISRGIYENVDHSLRALFGSKKHDYGFVKIFRVCHDNLSCRDQVHSLNSSRKLKDILGFDQKPDSENGFGFVEDEKIREDRPASLSEAFPDRLLMYCDLCGPYVTGDVQSSLLRIAPFDGTNYTYGHIRTITFSSPNYIPLLQNAFRTVEINIRDGRGHPVPFEYGPLNLTLHFKRVDVQI